MSNNPPELFKAPEGPYGWVQWKGTDVCIDIHCSCGVQGHIDGEFMYYVECKSCGQRYAVNGHVKLHPIAKGDENEQCLYKFADDETTVTRG